MKPLLNKGFIVLSSRPPCTIFELIYNGFTKTGKYCCLVSSTYVRQ